MIYGIGIDIVKIERVKTAVERWGNKFLQRVFTENEIAYSYKKNAPYPSLSARFAAKEALIKAAGSGISFSLTDIEVMNYGSGRPFLNIRGGLKTLFEERSIKYSHLSLSHELDYCVACVVLEGEG